MDNCDTCLMLREANKLKGSLLCSSSRGCSIMIEAEDFNESQLAKERKERENK